MASVVLRRIGGVFSNCMFGAPKHDKETDRERWDSRAAFILAASGSAIGLGNLWRFPALAYQYGGGAFFLPYLLALFLIGIPIAILEFALGQVVQSGDIACFGSMHKRLRGIGLGSVFGAFMVVTYYNVIVAWACIYLVNSFRSPIPWNVADDVTGEAVLEPGQNFFDNQVLRRSLDPADNANTIGGTQVGAVLFVWIAIAAIVWKGVSRTSKVVYVTMIVPLITLLILVIRGATLDGAGEGIRQYIGQWDFAVLSDGAAWSDAVSQIFFSIGVTFGVMTAYSSYNSRFQNTVSDALIISLTNSAVSVLAGFAVFSVLGFLSQRSGVPIADLKFVGISLAFLTYPVGLAELPAAGFFNVLFFLTLFFLGIDSAFSLVEAVCTAIKDSSKYNHVSRGLITTAVVSVGFFIGLLYTTNIGFYFLDIVDQYVSGIGMLFIGFMETFSSGWIYRIDEHVELVGWRAVYGLMFGWIGSTAFGCLVGGLSLAWVGAIVGGVLLIAFTAYAWFIAEDNELPLIEDSDDSAVTETYSHRSKAWKLFLFPVESLRSDLNAVIKAEGDGLEPEKKWAIPFVWALFIRYFIPPVLIIMLTLGIADYVGDGGYGADDGYDAKFQALGLIVALLVVVLVLVPAIRPSIMEGLIPNKLSGAQKLGALVPLGSGDDDDSELAAYGKEVASVKTKAAGSGLTPSDSEASLSAASESDELEGGERSTSAAKTGDIEMADAKKPKRKSSLSSVSDSA